MTEYLKEFNLRSSPKGPSAGGSKLAPAMALPRMGNNENRTNTEADSAATRNRPDESENAEDLAAQLAELRMPAVEDKVVELLDLVGSLRLSDDAIEDLSECLSLIHISEPTRPY